MKVKGRPKSKNVLRRDTKVGKAKDFMEGMGSFYKDIVTKKAKTMGAVRKGEPYEAYKKSGPDVALDRYIESKKPTEKEKEHAFKSAMGPKGQYKNIKRQQKKLMSDTLKDFSKKTKGKK